MRHHIWLSGWAGSSSGSEVTGLFIFEQGGGQAGPAQGGADIPRHVCPTTPHPSSPQECQCPPQVCALPLHSPLPEPLGSPCRGAPVTGLPSASASALSRRTSLLSCTAPSLGSRAEQSRTQTLGPGLATSVQILLLHELPVTLSHSGIFSVPQLSYL